MPQEQEPGTNLALPADIRADLLRAQKEAIQTPQNLPRIKVMPAGAGLFEFEDTNETAPSFRAVILNSHPRNVLWTKKFGTQVASETDETALMPECSSPDGKIGIPKVGFRHAALGGRAATENDRIECGRCPYNQFGSGATFIADKNPKGKAVTNQRVVYVLLEDREAPMALVLPATSLTEFDGYLSTLLNRGIPVQAVITEFYQTKEGAKGGSKYGQVHYRTLEQLTLAQLTPVLEKRSEYLSAMTPYVQPISAQSSIVEAEAEVEEDDTNLPF